MQITSSEPAYALISYQKAAARGEMNATDSEGDSQQTLRTRLVRPQPDHRTIRPEAHSRGGTVGSDAEQYAELRDRGGRR